VQGQQVQFELPFIHVAGKKILWVNGHNTHPEQGYGPVHILLLSNNPDIDLEALAQQYPFETVVFDRSNSRKNCRRWTEICQKIGRSCHNVAEAGAWYF
jgi:hypothetical protein